MAMIIMIILSLATFCDAEIPCESDFYCQQTLQRNATLCVDGYCSNPFQQGCLKTAGVSSASASLLFEGRICNSDDEASDSPCITSPHEALNYPEIRIHNGNWDTSIFQAWIYQIIFMELLGVPATVGLSTSDTKSASFYSPRNTMEYSAETYPYEAIKTSNDVKDCTTTQDPCVDVLPEVWEGQLLDIDPLIADGFISRPSANGQIGTGRFSVPAFTASEFPSVLSFYGLRGESRRQFLAETFKRPTTWLEYCQELSESRCDEEDDTAARFPNSQEEEALYFSEGLYNGYFQFTNGTGYIVTYPCTWSSNVEGMMYWNDIVGLKMDGPDPPAGSYSPSAIVQIWRAANATKSHVFLPWFEPDRMIEEFRGTDAEFVTVTFPDATQDCVENRPTTEMKCSNDTIARRGPEVASCGYSPSAQFKVVSESVGNYNFERVEEEAFQSPASDMITAMRLTTNEIETILNNWLQIGIDQSGNDAREAACGWVVDNIDKIQSFIPRTYPRTIRFNNKSYQQPLLYGAMSMGILSLLSVITAAAAVYILRKQRVMKYAQVDFILILLGGLFLVAVGAILSSTDPSNSSCIATIWLVVIGYTLELGPLIVKASAINKMMAASARMKRVKLRRRTLFGTVFVISMVALIFMICWTALDPWTLQEELVLSSDVDEHHGGGIIDVNSFCGSASDGWMYTSFAWRVLLLLWATVLAIQMRKVRSEFNESQQLAFVIYSHFIFIILQIIVVPLETILPHEELAGYRSFILSFDVIATVVIYFTPKLLRIYAPVHSKKFKQRFSTAMKRVSVVMFSSPSPVNNVLQGHGGGGATVAANGSSRHGKTSNVHEVLADVNKLEEYRARDLSSEQLERLLANRRRKSDDVLLATTQNETLLSRLDEEEDEEEVQAEEEEDVKSCGEDVDLDDLSNLSDDNDSGDSAKEEACFNY